MPANIKEDRDTPNMKNYVNQSVSMEKEARKLLIQIAKINGRSVSSEIMYRVKESLNREGIILH